MVSCINFTWNRESSNFKVLNYAYIVMHIVVCLAKGRKYMLFCQERIILPEARFQSIATYFNLSPIYHWYVLFVEILYQARFGLQISYPAILFTILIEFLNCGSFIVHALLTLTSKAFTYSFFMPDTQWYNWTTKLQLFCKCTIKPS